MYNQGLRNYIRCRNYILVRHVQIVPISALHGNDICICYDIHKDIVFKGHISLFYLLQSQKGIYDICLLHTIIVIFIFYYKRKFHVYWFTHKKKLL